MTALHTCGKILVTPLAVYRIVSVEVSLHVGEVSFSNSLLCMQMCVVRRTSDKCWYRARVQNVLQTLNGPQARYITIATIVRTL